jgi:hypothetical protein
MTHLEQTWTADVLTAFSHNAEPALTPLPGEVDYVSAFKRMRRGSTALARLGLRAAIWMVALAPLWFLGRVATFSRLGRNERTELLRRLLIHPSFIVRELTLLLKLTAAMALLGTVSVRARSGYDAAPNNRPQQESSVRVHLPLMAHAPTEVSQVSDATEVQRAVS